MNKNSEGYWLCWSRRQKAFHIEPETAGLEVNQRAFIEDVPVDYVPIGRFANAVEASMRADQLRELISARDPKRRFL